MSLKVHLLGPRSNKFPYKSEISCFIKINSTVQSMLEDKMAEEHLTLEEALLKALSEGANIIMKEHNCEEHNKSEINSESI